MTDEEIMLGKQVGEGLHASELYSNPLIQSFLAETETYIINGLKNTKMDEYEKREDFYRMLKMLDSFKGMFQSYMDRGTSAQEMLNKIKRGVFDNL